MKAFKALLIALGWGLYSLSGLLLAMALAWLVLFKLNFGYGWLHDVLEIEQVVQQYGPQNRYRHGFEHTGKAERVRLFAAISHGVHHQGEGLAAIRYHDSAGKDLGPLLHRAEIIHLNDVAKLLVWLKYVVLAAALTWLGMLLLYRFGRIALPGFKQQLGAIAGLTALSGLLLGLMGPVKVFYALHRWVFPAGHQWFFYYQDSLMSTLMKAPDLFGGIALLLLLLGLGIFMLLNGLVYGVCAAQCHDQKRA